MKTKFKLSNRIFSLVLALVMVLGMMPMTAVPAYAATESPCSGDHTGWTALSGSSIEITSPGKYYLSKDCTTSSISYAVWIECSGEVALCLNGKNLVYEGDSASHQAIYIYSASTFDLCDCSGNGSIKSKYGGIGIRKNITFNMYGGTIENCYKSNGYGSAIGFDPNVTFNMYGGTITGCNNGNNDGGAIGTYWDTTAINLYGGTITGNNKYGVYTNGGPIYVSGNVKITGNTLGDVYLPKGKTITVGTFTTGADIGVTSGSGGNDIAITGTNATDYSNYFHADNSNYQILNKDNVIYLHKHSYSAATCVAPASCSCGLTEGTIDSTNHNPATEYTTAGGKHYKECLNGCGTKFEEEDCSGDSSITCTNEGTCTTCGGKYTNSQAHNLSYTVVVTGNIITEKCDNGCGHTATATLDADEAYIYTGSAITPATIDYSDNWQGEKPTDISYVNNVDVGTATATITVEGQTLTKNFQIKNAYSVSFNANGGSGAKGSETIADGEEYTLPANPFTAPSGYQFKGWATSQNGNVLQDEKIIVSENVTLYAIWEKIPAEMPTVAVSENLTLTYGEYTGQKFTAIVEKKDGYTYKYQWIDGNTVISNTDTLEIPDNLAAGVYDYYLAVGAKRTDNGEITWYRNPNLSVTVNPKNLDASNVTLSQDTFTYDGKEQIPTVTVKVGGKTLTEYTDYDVILPSNCKNVGTKTIIVTFRGNYSGSAQIDYEIEEKEIGVFWGPSEFLPYTGELIVPQAKAIGLADGDVCTLTTSVVETTEGAGIVPGRWHAKVTSLSNDNYCLPASGNLVEVEYGIVKGNIAAPVVSGIEETIKGKADGKINGLTTEMEYATEYTADDDKYTKVTDANMTFAPGTYYVRYQAAGYYNASSFTEVVIKEGGLLSVMIPQTQTGYTIATEDTELVWNGSTTLSFTLKDGYSKTGAFAVKVNGTPIALDANNRYVITNAQENIVITVEGVADITPPAAEIKVKENKWTSFWNNLTFGLFFKETQDVTITATDKGSGVKSIQYYLFDRELELGEVRLITDWIDYNGTFKINPDNRYVVYAKITDNDGNVEYINSDGIVLDATAPVLYGIEDGGVYHGDKVFKAMDENFLKIEVDGVDITNTTEGDAEFKIAADNAEHTVTVTDKAGNVTEYKITVYKKYMVTYSNGEGGSYEKEFKYGEVITIPTNEFFNDTFRKTGYTVKEWQGYTEGMTMPLKDLTFTVVYAPCEYTITFDQNGGEVINPITVTFGEKYGSLPSSAITGLSGGNKNWYLVDADGNVTETNIKNLTPVSTTRDHKLFIKRNVLAPSVSVALTVPGGISDGYQYYIPGASKRVLTATIGNMNTDILEYTYRWYKDGTLIEGATSNVLTLDGNVSDSGTYKVEVTAKLKDGTNIVVGSDTSTASKEQKVKILHATNMFSYDANGGEGGPQSSYTGGTGLNVSKDVPTREHYNFIGWNTAPDGTGNSYKAEDAYAFANDNGNGGCEVTLYAQWKLVEYTVTYKADGEPISTETVGHGKDATLPAVPAKDGYVGKWDIDGKNITGDTTITAVYTAVPIVKPDEVKPVDKTDLENTKAMLEEMLEHDSYTDGNKKDIQDAIDEIDDALEVIGNVEVVEELIDKLPESITKNDEDAIKAADDAYNALTAYEKSLVGEEAKKALDDARAALAGLNKPVTDPESPQTGDNSNIFHWIVLLFISGGAVITLTVVDRRKRYTVNK